MKFTEVIKNLSPTDQGGWTVEAPDDWRQGRAIYGGLSSALCFEAATRTSPQTPPLRSAQITFIGPADGPMTFTAEEIRRGRSATFVSVAADAANGPVSRALFVFGASRTSVFDESHLTRPALPAPDACDLYAPEGSPRPGFMKYFEARLASGGRFGSGSKAHEKYLWARHKDPVPGMTGLIGIADFSPPAISQKFTTLAPISSVTWIINILRPELAEVDGWRLLKSSIDNARDGYSSQSMVIWNESGEAIAAGGQSVAIFT